MKCKKYDITTTFNSDGSPVFTSAKYSIWPIQMLINELPPKLRWDNLLLPALYFGKSHPNMGMFLKFYVEEMQDLNATGITWRCENEIIHSRILCICCCVDAPAHASMQNITQFNGYNGCPWCLHPGELFEGECMQYGAIYICLSSF